MLRELEPEKTRELSLQSWEFPFCLHDLVNHVGLTAGAVMRCSKVLFTESTPHTIGG